MRFQWKPSRLEVLGVCSTEFAQPAAGGLSPVATKALPMVAAESPHTGRLGV